MVSEGVHQAERLVAEFPSTDGKWKNGVSQLRKLLPLCDEEGRQDLPETEREELSF